MSRQPKPFPALAFRSPSNTRPNAFLKPTDVLSYIFNFSSTKTHLIVHNIYYIMICYINLYQLSCYHTSSSLASQEVSGGKIPISQRKECANKLLELFLSTTTTSKPFTPQAFLTTESNIYHIVYSYTDLCSKIPHNNGCIRRQASLPAHAVGRHAAADSLVARKISGTAKVHIQECDKVHLG